MRVNLFKHFTWMVIISMLICSTPFGIRLVASEEALEWYGPDHIEVCGRAENFILLEQPPFFMFTLRVNSTLTYEVEGCEHADFFMNEKISPVFANLTINWEAEPDVKAFGRINGNEITAFFVDVKVSGEWENWYYKSFLTRDERTHFDILWYYSRRYGGKQEFVTWVEGNLTEDDLLYLIVSWEDGNLTVPFPIPPEHLGKQAYVNGVIRGAGGIALAVKEIYVKQGDTYIKVYEKETGWTKGILIEAWTDKACYQPGDKGKLHITIKNEEDMVITICNITVEFPWHSHIKGGGNVTKSIGEALETGETYNVEVEFSVPNEGRALWGSWAEIKVMTDASPWLYSVSANIPIASPTISPATNNLIIVLIAIVSVCTGSILAMIYWATKSMTKLTSKKEKGFS